MNRQSSYRELNLREGADFSEIKAAFRQMAKNYHPDTAGESTANVDKFRRAYQAYRTLINSNIRQNPKPVITAPESTPYHFEGSRTFGLDVYYDLAMIKPNENATINVVLPCTIHEACPRCLGHGQTLAKVGHGEIYRPQTCPKCGGLGLHKRQSQLNVKITPEMIKKGKFRLRQAGEYLPNEARRGDLIVNLKWVDRLPTGN